jgi:hypothetical protein
MEVNKVASGIEVSGQVAWPLAPAAVRVGVAWSYKMSADESRFGVTLCG